MKSPIKTGFPILMVLLLSACSTLPPAQSDRSDVPFELPQQWQGSGEQRPLSDQLLALIDDPALTRRVEQALAGNLDLRQTALRLQEQRLLSRQTRAAEKPQLDLALDSQRNETDNSPTSNHSLALNLSWELDVWGRLADASSAAEAETRAQQRDYQAARNSLAARIIQSWVELSLRQQIIEAEQARIQSLRNTEAVITERYRDGIGNVADLDAARAATARAEASLAARSESRRAALRALNLLTGDSPQRNNPQPLAIPAVSNPPTSIPAEVIAARPDLQAAYSRILAADKQTAVAYKALLPGFSLSASLSQSRPELGDLLSGSTAWNLLGRLTAPLFNAGRLQAGADIAASQAQRAWLSYQQTLLTALLEVEDALGQEAALARQQRALSRALGHADASFEHYRARYREGLVDILDLLTAEQSAFDARTALLQVRQDRLNNRITLGLALGMGV